MDRPTVPAVAIEPLDLGLPVLCCSFCQKGTVTLLPNGMCPTCYAAATNQQYPPIWRG